MSKDLELLRFNMVEQQIRPWEVLDQKVLSLLRSNVISSLTNIKQLFILIAEIHMGHGQFMLAPKLEARLIQSTKSDKPIKS